MNAENEETAGSGLRAEGPSQDPGLRYYARLVAHIDEAVTITDRNGYLTGWNPAAEQLFGLRKVEVLGRAVEGLLRREHNGVTPAEAQQILQETGRWRGEMVVHLPDGRILLTDVQRILVPDEAGAGYLELSRDISEQKRAEATIAQHAQRLEILHDIDRAILAARSPAVIAQGSMARLRMAIHCERASVVLLDEGAGKMHLLAGDGSEVACWREDATQPIGLHPSSLYQMRSGQPVLVGDLRPERELGEYGSQVLQAGYRSWLAVPLVAESELIGALMLMANRPSAFGPADVELVRQVADSLAVALWHSHLFAQVQASRAELQTLSRRLVEILENERRTIAQELHDEAAQSISSLMLGLGLLERDQHATERMRAQIEFMKETADDVLENLHRLAMRLRPASLDRLGLVPALRQHLEVFRQQSGINVEFEVRGMDGERLPPEVEIALYRVVQEALSNVLRHAQATNVGVILQRRGETVRAIIEDDGVGFDAEEAAARGRLGVLGMRERVEMLGGKLTLETAPGAGVTLFLEVPCGTRA